MASSGGTSEIAGLNASVIKDLDWDMSPLDLYSPPALDYSKEKQNCVISNIDIIDVGTRYIHALGSI